MSALAIPVSARNSSKPQPCRLRDLHDLHPQMRRAVAMLILARRTYAEVVEHFQGASVRFWDIAWDISVGLEVVIALFPEQQFEEPDFENIWPAHDECAANCWAEEFGLTALRMACDELYQIQETVDSRQLDGIIYIAGSMRDLAACSTLLGFDSEPYEREIERLILDV